MWLTTPDRSALLTQGAALPLTQAPASGHVVVVNDQQTFQQFLGVGASLTGASAALLSGLAPGARDALLHQLFAGGQGIGLGVLRQPIGANDFSTGNFSYDQLPPGSSDPALARFSLAPDERTILPLLRQIRGINPALTVVASPWSAPGWMKTSGSLIGGTLDPRWQDAYAHYLVRFLQGYASRGVPVAGLTVANEPTFSPPGYAGMTLSVDQQRSLIDDHLAPALAAAGVSTKVYALDDNFDRLGDALALLDNPVTRGHVAGVAFHCYRGDPSAVLQLREAHPHVAVGVSECSGGSFSGSFGDALRGDVQRLLIEAVRGGASWITKWNLALDPQGGPTNGGCTTCRGLVTIDPATHAVSFNEEYYALGQVGRFVRPGAVVVASTTFGAGNIQTVAFRNPDGGHVLLAFNSAGDSRTFAVSSAGRSFSYQLPAGAVATFTW